MSASPASPGPPGHHLESSSPMSSPLAPTTNNVRVAVRVRPLNQAEEQKGCQMSLCVHDALERTPRQHQFNIFPVTTANNADGATQTPKASNNKLHQQFPDRQSFLVPPSQKFSLKSPQLGGPTHQTGSPSVKHPTAPRASPVPTATNAAAALVATNNLPTRLSVESSSSSSSSIRREFELDAVFPPTATQADVYDSLVGGDAISSNLFRGYNTTILAYGQTGSGKTYTMGASATATCSSSVDDGIICRAIQDLFRGKQQQDDNQRKNDWDVTITLNCLELFNDEFRDLLAEDGRSEACNAGLKLRSVGDSGVEVEGVANIVVPSIQDATELIDRAAAQRTTSSTLMNEQSSRSHAIYTFQVTKKSKTNGLRESIVRAKLTLVDLAGSERIKKSGVVGLQQKESININKDLFVLGKVVSQLAECSDRRGGGVHIPYRDSKLTRLLQDSLGGTPGNTLRLCPSFCTPSTILTRTCPFLYIPGNCCTLLIACVSPADMHVEESLNTLRYAERSRSITNLVKKNSFSATPLLTQKESDALRAENQWLKEELEKLRSQMFAGVDSRVSAGTCVLSSGLSGLQEKLRLAQEEAELVKDSSHSVAEEVESLKDRYQGWIDGQRVCLDHCFYCVCE